MKEELKQKKLDELKIKKLTDIYNQALELCQMSEVIDKYCEYYSKSEPIYNLCVMTKALVKATNKIGLCISQTIELDKEADIKPFNDVFD